MMGHIIIIVYITGISHNMGIYDGMGRYNGHIIYSRSIL